MKISALTAAVALACGATTAQAAVTITITQNAGGVTATTSGSLNTTGFTKVATATLVPTVRGTSFFFAGTNGAIVNAYSGFTGPTFGTTSMTGASFSSGDPFGFNLVNNRLFLPVAYVSGAAINSTATWQYLTLSGMGLSVGSYVYTIGTERVTLNIGQPVAAVPEPATWALMLLGFGLIGGAARRRSAVRTTVRHA
ncbi:PEPxxWA-CTERM sorting domain-containing protein [Sphingomonas sp. PAMC 26621]|uniref:PEPxxWA-CTERM sorting domain-containing protein n=1 Tax=Sphingomonas sp. PAMC 26621 TaxID=1112213 RepID=UPI000289EC97|nr:PEPxxWA-CTERM sorting domain-containing protein [Sphingomonas sp. PAMC 26621]